MPIPSATRSRAKMGMAMVERPSWRQGSEIGTQVLILVLNGVRHTKSSELHRLTLLSWLTSDATRSSSGMFTSSKSSLLPGMQVSLEGQGLLPVELHPTPPMHASSHFEFRSRATQSRSPGLVRWPRFLGAGSLESEPDPSATFLLAGNALFDNPLTVLTPASTRIAARDIEAAMVNPMGVPVEVGAISTIASPVLRPIARPEEL